MIILSSGARALLEFISVRAINWISLYTSRSKAIKWISVLTLFYMGGGGGGGEGGRFYPPPDCLLYNFR